MADDLPSENDRPRPATDRFAPGEVEVSAPAPHRLDARVTQSSGGWLVFHEQWAAGWKATVNGADAPVVRADHVYRAVAIPPGDSVVRTEYEPTSMRLSALLSLVACAAAAMFVVRAVRGSRSRPLD
jgi:uncharacterized membrane protein YfhO